MNFNEKKYNYEEIEQQLKDGDQYFLYNINPDKPYLLCQGKTEEELHNKLNEIIEKDKEYYKNIKCILNMKQKTKNLCLVIL